MRKLFVLSIIVLCASAVYAQTPTVTTIYRSRQITQTTATAGGNITYSGNSGDIVRRGIVYSTSPNPKVSDFRIRKGSGSGQYTIDITGLTPNTKYYLRAYAVTAAGRFYGDERTFTTLEIPTYGSVMDIDANTYTTVIVGTQEWMMENLKTTRYSNGDPIQHVTANAAWYGLATASEKGGFCDYGNNPANAATYGRLYNWYAASDPRSIAPAGFRVPTRSDWSVMETYLGAPNTSVSQERIGAKLKETGTSHWNTPNPATNVSGFTALPGGWRSGGGSFTGLGNTGPFWSSSTVNPNSWAYFRRLDNNNDDITYVIVAPEPDHYKLRGHAVRCVRDVTFTISASSNSGGSVTPSGGVIVNKWTDQSFSIVPHPDYEIAGVTVDGTPLPGPISNYTFTRISQNHSITVQFAPLPGSIAGTVSLGSAGMSGVTVKLLDAFGNPVAGVDPVLTDASGGYAFNMLPPAAYQVMLVEPLGYLADQSPKSVTVQPNAASTLNFALTQIVVTNAAVGIGYWKHQFDVHVTSRGHAQESAAQLTDYIATVHSRYTPHYPVLVGVHAFTAWQGTLTVTGNQPMFVRAKQQLAALLLNLASLKIAQYTIATADGRTVGDVLTYVSDLMSDNNASNDGLAKNLAESINQQQLIGAGIVPAGSILYKDGTANRSAAAGAPRVFSLSQNYPNPFNPTTTIGYTIPENARVQLRVFDALGRVVAELENGMVQAGAHSITFDAPRDLPSGSYLYRLETNGTVLSGKMSLMK